MTATPKPWKRALLQCCHGCVKAARAEVKEQALQAKGPARPTTTYGKRPARSNTVRLKAAHCPNTATTQSTTGKVGNKAHPFGEIVR